MRCAKCGADVKPTDPCCPDCMQICTEIQTIEDIQAGHETHEKPGEESGYYACKNTGPGYRIHVKQINVSRLGFWSRLLGIVILIAVFIVALPLAVLLTCVFSIFWLILRRRH